MSTFPLDCFFTIQYSLRTAGRVTRYHVPHTFYMDCCTLFHQSRINIDCKGEYQRYEVVNEMTHDGVRGKLIELILIAASVSIPVYTHWWFWTVFEGSERKLLGKGTEDNEHIL